MFLVLPSGNTFWVRVYSPPETNHDAMAAMTMSEKTMTNVWGNFLFDAMLIDFETVAGQVNIQF